MLDNLRANKGGIITYFFLFAIIIVFVVSFGPGSFDKGCKAERAAGWAADVNGQVIQAAEYQQAYSNLLRTFQQQAGQAFSRELAEQLGLQNMAMNQLVERALVTQEARKQGLVISDEALAKAIVELPGFKGADGRFDREGYLRAVEGAYGSVKAFEKVMREDLLYQRMLAGLKETVKVSDGEVREAWTTEHDKVSLRFVRFPLAAAETEVKRPTTMEVVAFVASQGARLEQAYKDQASRFDQPKRVRARHILVKVATGAPAEADAAAKQKLEAAAARIAKGEDFGLVAGAVSEDAATKARGGDLGFVAEGMVEKAFADAAFALEQGKVSPPVRTAAGWHLIRADQVVPAKKVSLDEARAQLAPELIVKDRAAALAKEKAAAALAAVKAGKSLAELYPTEEEAKKAKKLPVKLGAAVVAAETTGPFGDQGPYVPKLGAAAELAAAALAGTAGKPLDKIFETPQGPVVAVVESRERPDPAQFAAQKDLVTQRLISRKEQQVQQIWMKQLRDAAKVKTNDALTAPGASPVEAG